MPKVTYSRTTEETWEVEVTDEQLAALRGEDHEAKDRVIQLVMDVSEATLSDDISLVDATIHDDETGEELAEWC